MTYYIKSPGVKFDPMISACQLGEVSLNKFWPQQGWEHLKWMMDNTSDENISKIIILDGHGKEVELQDVLTKITALHMA